MAINERGESMNNELVTDEPFKFKKLTSSNIRLQEKYWSILKELQKISPFNKEKPKGINMQQVGLGNTRISTHIAQMSPQTLMPEHHIWGDEKDFLFLLFLRKEFFLQLTIKGLPNIVTTRNGPQALNVYVSIHYMVMI